MNENEINHNDNAEVIDNRKNGKIASISPNKVINTTNRSNKRKKCGWEF